MDAKAYMARRCVCGLTRGEHAHFHQQLDGKTILRVLPVANPTLCLGFLDEFELELGGCPQDNAHLGPLVEEELSKARIRENGPVS